MRINLIVPYSQKERAKKAGAQWDNLLKTWYKPDHVSQMAVFTWLPPDLKQTIVKTARHQSWKHREARTAVSKKLRAERKKSKREIKQEHIDRLKFKQEERTQRAHIRSILGETA